MRLNALYRYPVKGLSPQAIDSAELETGGYFPGDRLFAVENGPSGFDFAAPVHQPKIKFLMLMRNARLASLATHYEDASGVLTIVHAGRAVAGDLRDPNGRAAIEAFLDGFCADELRGPVRLLEAPKGFRFTDSKSGFVSLVNLATVEAIGEKAGRRIDPLRFRANLYLEGLPAWREHELVGRTLLVGGVRLEILKTTDRCAATAVEPGSGLRDVDVVQTLRDNWGHVDCGVYARVAEGGRLQVGDGVEILKA
jgi:uncharacterized protein YcbX